MELKLDGSQQILQRSAREFLANEAPRSLARAMETDSDGFSRPLWMKMADLGWLGLSIPTEYGGAGGSMADLVVLFEELGRAIPPVPMLVSNVLGAGAVLELGSASQKQAVLPAVAAGDRMLSFAYLEPEGTWRPEGIQLRARAVEGGWQLDGVKLFVPYAGVADQLVVVARTESAGTEGISVFLVDRTAGGVNVEKLITVDGRPSYEVRFENVRVGNDALLGPSGAAWNALSRALARAAILQSAELTGIVQVMLDLAVEFSKTRVQFGRPIAVFQAISHKLANMSIDVDSLRLMTYEAAWALDSGLPANEAVTACKSLANTASRRAAQGATEVMGGLGFMEVHDLGLYFKRQKTGELNLGDASFFHSRLFQEIAAL